jgi:hypothetical protein
MSQNLTNDLPDRFASSDEDEDDEEVVGWMGETGEFESRSPEGIIGSDEEVNGMREFGRRGLFQERWDSDFPDDEEMDFGHSPSRHSLEGGEDRVTHCFEISSQNRFQTTWRPRIIPTF